MAKAYLNTPMDKPIKVNGTSIDVMVTVFLYPLGQGLLKLEDGTEFSGEFKDHKPNGIIMITFPDQGFYKGSMNMGLMNGEGNSNFLTLGELLSNIEKYYYKGSFVNNIKQGEGYF